jgi:hypothetical protein
MILLHDPESGAQVYSLNKLEGIGICNAEARVSGVPYPVSFMPGSPLAILGAVGM